MATIRTNKHRAQAGTSLPPVNVRTWAHAQAQPEGFGSFLAANARLPNQGAQEALSCPAALA